MNKPIIEFRDFSFQYRSQKSPTLNNINLSIYPGEKILIVGPSGSGKSTLGHCLNGLIPFSYPGEVKGTLTINDVDVSSNDIFTASKSVGTVLQDADSQFVGLNVGEDIAFALENDNVPLQQMHDKVNKIAKIVDMDTLLDRSPYELSGGQKQRACLAGVMVLDTPILLFDEPLANLDPATGKIAIELIDEIAQDKTKTVIIIEHRLEDVLHRHVDRIILINEGTVLADSRPNELLKSNLLEANGIRLPLYVSALKYAGVDLNQVELLEKPYEYRLNDQQKKMCQTWYHQQSKKEHANNENTILKLDDVCFSYDGIKNNVDHISLDIHANEMISIVGKNGAGKSTLSKCIVGFEKIDSGAIYFDGQDIKDWSIKEKGQVIGYVLQNPNQMISKTMIYDEVALGLVQLGLDEATIKERVYETLKICGLYAYRNWPISALSYGQKKRVTIASILALRPKVLILDEPTAGQDYHHYSDIMGFLKELNNQGITIVLITHDMHLMLEYTPRCIVITDGKILGDTKSSIVLSDQALIEKAYLKQTSLYGLAAQLNDVDPIDFIDTFIDFEEENGQGETHEN